MATKIPYLILQEKPLQQYSVIDADFVDNLPEDGKVQNLLDYAASIIPSLLGLDGSQQVVMLPVAYMLIDPIPAFFGRPIVTIAQELGVIDKAFLDTRAARWSSRIPLSQLGIKTEGNVGQLLVIFTFKDVDRSLAFVQADLSSTSNALIDSRRKRRLFDPSHIRESWRSKRLKKHLPSIEELIGVLEEPLVDSEKISITELMYTSLISMLSPDMCGEDTIETLFKIGEFDPSLALFFTAVTGLPPAEGTEKSFHSFWDDNIRKPIELLIPTGKSIRNSNKHVETRKLRPDYGFILQNICPFRGEENGPGISEDPKAELADKFKWVYEPVPYMLGYYCRGSEMTLAAITAPVSQRAKPNVHDLISLDLRWRKNRIANIRHLINLSTILPRLTELVRFPVDDFRRFVRTNSTVEITSTLIIKTYPCENATAKVGFLRQIYEVIATRYIPNTDVLVFANKNVVHLSPRGIAGQPLVEKELRECVICVLESLIVAHRIPLYHRDIQWNNVIRKIEDHSKWFLIDWEDAAMPPTKAQLSFTRSSHSPAIFEDGHGADVDIWGVGHLIKTCPAADVSMELRALGDRICEESQSLTAEEVLKLVSPTSV